MITMLNLEDVFHGQIKLTPEQVNYGLWKSGHITKEQYDYLQKLDAKEKNNSKWVVLFVLCRNFIFFYN